VINSNGEFMVKTADDVIRGMLDLIREGFVYFKESTIQLTKGDSLSMEINLRDVAFDSDPNDFKIISRTRTAGVPEYLLVLKEHNFIYKVGSHRNGAILSLANAKLKLRRRVSLLIGGDKTEKRYFYNLHLILLDGLFTLIMNEIQERTVHKPFQRTSCRLSKPPRI
jgi:hypothetical protein